MRFPLLAGMAALATAADLDYDDDDMNFLRLLSSNTSNATTVAATTAMASNTTAAAGNTTTAAATTTAATGNTTMAATTVAQTTVAGNQTTAAPTTVAPTTPTPVSGGGDTNSVTLTTLCSAEAYTALDMTSPATFASDRTARVVSVSCTKGTDSSGNPIAATGLNVNAATLFDERGPLAGTQDKACTDAPVSGTVKKMTCAATDSNYLANFNAMLKMAKCDNTHGSFPICQMLRAELQYCCGNAAAVGVRGMSLIAPKNIGAVTRGQYTDSGCTTAAKESDMKADQWFGHTVMFPGATDMTGTITLGECTKMVGGMHVKMAMCNGTAEGGMHMIEAYMGEPTTGKCDYLIMSQAQKNQACTLEQSSSRLRLLGAHNSTSTAKTYLKIMCSAEAPAKLQFETQVATAFTGVTAADLDTPTKKTAFKTSYETKALEVYTAAVNSASALITAAHAYSGLLAARRQLQEKRTLASHQVATGVVSTFTTVVPYADATTVKAAVDTAKSSGTMAPATLAATIQTELSTAGFNVTATTSVVVSDPVPDQAAAAPSGGGGSTSGTSVAQFFGVGSALLAVFAMLF